MTEQADKQGTRDAGEDGGVNRQQRRRQDRRKQTVPALRYLIFGGRRKAIRRREDQHQIVLLDLYSSKLFAAIMGIICLSLIDALLTLYLIDHGSTEINPVMLYFLNKGPLVFTVAKYILTSIAVVIFLVVANSVLPRYNFHAHKLFAYALAAFGLVIVWEIILIFFLTLRA